jgi:hypothetical protein
VAILGVTAQLRSTDVPFLDSSTSDCDCFVNQTLTLHEQQLLAANTTSDDGFFASIYRISYIYYSMIGTMLTIIFGLIISLVTDMHANNEMTYDDAHEGGFRTSIHHFPNVSSFLSNATQRRLSSFIHNVSQSTLRVENKIKEVISHTNLPHLHHLHMSADDEERISILNEEDDDVCSSSSGSANRGNVHMNTGRKKMFFIGHQDDREHDE